MRATQRLTETTVGFWVGLVLAVLAGAVDVLKLVLNLMYLYAQPDAMPAPVDPVSSFMLGLGAIWAVGYLLKGLRGRSVWAAVGLVVAAPILYLLMVDGMAVALVHNGMYFTDHWLDSWWIEVVPSCGLVGLYGFEALRNYEQRFRRLR